MSERAAIYARVSTDRQDAESQLGPCRAYIEDRGWELHDVYIDHGRSAYKDEVERPEFNRLLADARRRRFQHIVSFAQDRFSRQPPVKVLDLCRELAVVYGVQVHAVNGDEWRDAIEVINQLASQGGSGYMSRVLPILAEMLETIMRGAMAEQARYESRKLGRRVVESRRYQRALERGEVGRPAVKVPEDRAVEVMREHPTWGWRRVAGQLRAEGHDISTATLRRRLAWRVKKVDGKWRVVSGGPE